GSAQGDFCAALHGKNVEGQLVSTRLVRSCHQEAIFQNGRSELQHPSHSKHSVPARQGHACLQSQQ
ncbi:hypothetical protein HGM15179_006976, partial [Zosterops borbonicus]